MVPQGSLGWLSTLHETFFFNKREILRYRFPQTIELKNDRWCLIELLQGLSDLLGVELRTEY